jgi:agmatine/peptidylarginine deiminase
MKFASNLDNQSRGKLYVEESFNKNTGYFNMLHFVLEAAASNQTARNHPDPSELSHFGQQKRPLLKEEIEDFLKSVFGADRMLWINQGYLSATIPTATFDTLARLCDEKPHRLRLLYRQKTTSTTSFESNGRRD